MSEAIMNAAEPIDTEALRAALRQHFGHDAFRPGQESIVRSVLSGRPSVAILPTGGGKSLCYQLPALLLQGTTVVVSPLVALMKDQVDALVAKGVSATFINSSLTDSERSERISALRRGAYRLVYVAPERFRSSAFLNAIGAVRCPLLAIDEAHCISAWGHDFRPDYQRLAQARAQLKAERVLALTATATPEVRRDIADALQMQDPRVFVAGFDRPNLFIEVDRVSGDKEKLGHLFALARTGAPGLVYCATRKNVEKVVAAMQAAGLHAMAYHAGLDDAQRSSVQDAFLQGRVPVVAATNAFGMGVDKPDIRFVAHFDVPRSLEAYYQEIGRAGRDGQDSMAVLLFNYADVLMQRRMIDSSYSEPAFIRRVWDEARRSVEGSADALAGRLGAHPAEVLSAVKLLESAGHLERRRGSASGFAVLTPQVNAADLDVPFELIAQRAARERQMLDRLIRFTDTSSCRRRNLLRYFGESDVRASCGACDCCSGSRAPAPEAVADVPRKRSSPRADAASRPAAPEGPFDANVFAELRTLRTELARELSVPPYVVCHDSMMRELARALPKNEQEFLLVKGMGPARWQKFGPRIIAVTAKAAGRPAPAQQQAPLPQAVSDRDEEIPRYGAAARRPPDAWGPPPPEPPRVVSAGERVEVELTYELYQQGHDLETIARKKNDAIGAVASELAQALLAGKPVDVQRVLGAERLRAIRDAAPPEERDLVAIRRRLQPVPVSLGEIRLALVSRPPKAC
jgi:ATP-dependent DNA helicase RecQ